LTEGVDGGREGKGNVKNMLLDISKLKSLGWRPKLNSRDAVGQTIRDLINGTQIELHVSAQQKLRH
jgi:UDP-glucose 4-epimerase